MLGKLKNEEDHADSKVLSSVSDITYFPSSSQTSNAQFQFVHQPHNQETTIMFQPIQTSFLACSLLFSASTLAQHSVTNRLGESTECSKKGEQMQCQSRIEAFTFEDQPYVFEKEENNLFIYRPLEYDIDITDEDNVEEKCGEVIPNQLIFCEYALSDFEHDGLEWRFDSRRNGFLEYKPRA